MAFGRHLKALLWKNWLLWKRNLFGSLCEVLLPIILIGAVAGIRQAVKNKDFEGGDNLADGFLFANVNSESDPSDFLLSMANFGFDPLTNTDPFGFLYAKNYTLVGDQTDERLIRLNDTIQETFANINSFLNETSQIEVKYTEGIETEEALFELIRSNSYQRDSRRDSLMFAVKVPEDEANLNYTIYMSANFPTLIPNTEEFSITELPNFENFETTAGNGFLTVQYLIARSLLKETDVGDFTLEMFVAPGSNKAFTRDEFMENIGPSLALFLLLIYIAPQYRMVSFLTTEKASRAREGMKIMGLTDTPYWVSWLIYYLGVCLTISIVCTLIFTLVLFPNSSFIILFLFVFLYGMSIFSFCLLIAALLQRPRVACILSTLLHFLTYFATTPIANPNTSRAVKTIFSIVPNIAMPLGLTSMTALEANGKGANFTTLSNSEDGTTVSIAFIMWTLMFFVLGLLALYLDNVLPKEYGKKQPLCFMFTKKYWVGENSGQRHGNHEKLLEDNDDELNGGNRNFEAVPQNIREQEGNGECMKVRKLRKVYDNGKEAVKDLSLTMYQNQIFALLGHNGAGKTTTLSILTGLYQPTSGEASVFNLDMFGQVNELRTMLGVCPQFDILFDQLTPIEHLKLYCMFKGVDPAKYEEEIEKTIKDVDLQSKRNTYAKNLSGGQKRKLSVGIAMIGGSKLVLLDEPTSGMDLTARRRIWDMLKNNKQNRILILTTHFMDEADILGDRIAIMAGGTIKCCGGSLFLKRRYGVGYNLVLAKESKEPNPSIDDFVNEKIPNAIKLSEVSSEVTYQIPQTESNKFEDFFTDLDSSLKDLKIKSYGVGVTTLEEVFLRVGKEDDDDMVSRKTDVKQEIMKEIEEEKQETVSKNRSLNDSSPISIDEYSIAEESEQGEFNIFMIHFKALTIKRFLVSFRQIKTSLLEILIPIILIVGGLALANIEFFVDPEPVMIDSSQFPTPNSLFHATSADGIDQTNIDTYLNPFGEGWDVTDIGALTGPDLKTKLQSFEQGIFPDQGAYDQDVNNIGNHVINSLDKTQNIYQTVGFANSHGRDGAAVQMQYMINSILNVAAPEKKFIVNNHPFPLTAAATAGAKAGSGSIVAFLFAIAFAMIPAGVASSIVAERESNVKHQQFISGASMISYWISNYVVDFIRSLIPIMVAIIFIFIFGVDLPQVWVIFLLFAISIHPFTYATTFWFKKEGSAQTLTILLHIIFGGFLAIAVLVLMSFPSTRGFGRVFRWFPKVIPTFCAINAILQIASRQIFAVAAGSEFVEPPLSFDVAGGDAIFLAINFFLWWGILILNEGGYLNFNFCRRTGGDFDATRRTENLKTDGDVQAEENRCDELNPSENSVLVKRLRKVYTVQNNKAFVAVRNISFGLEYGECFALLGVNGAGKTTTFKSMTGDVTPSDGKIYIDGLDLSVYSQFSRARKLIGYCPQENAIFEGMTVKEHLVFYSRIKGIVANKRDELMEQVMKEMDLKEFENVRCEELSGGNKRKLSVAMAIIGNPPIVFLDEPSTGMDPRAKRFMWTIISRISTLRKKSTVILTTHSMEEAEALCTKMGIMVNGRFKCYGSSQHIKDKFGTGFEVDIKVAWPTNEEARELAERHNLDVGGSITAQNLESTLRHIQMDQLLEVEQYYQIRADIEKDGSMSIIELCQWALLEDCGLFIKRSLEKNTTNCIVLEHYNNFFKFRIERGEKSLGFFFGFMEKLKKDIKFEEYAVSQTTLEQIFNAFAQEQDLDEPGDKAMRRRSTVRKEKEL